VIFSSTFVVNSSDFDSYSEVESPKCSFVMPEDDCIVETCCLYLNVLISDFVVLDGLTVYV
jgi:hypothetical protein